MDINYKGALACTINLYQWPRNCGYVIISGISLGWGWPKQFGDDLSFVVDVVSSYYPRYQAALFSTHESSTGAKLKAAATEGVGTIHSGVTKYGGEAKVELHMWNPSEKVVKGGLRGIEKKYGLEEGSLDYGVSDYEARMTAGGVNGMKGGLEEMDK